MTSWKAKLKAVIDVTIPKAKDFDDFMRLMEAAGYEIKRGKFISFHVPGQECFTTVLRRLGKRTPWKP